MGAKTAEKKEKAAKGKGVFLPDVGVCRVISLGGGTHAYVLNGSGKTLHVRVGTQAWDEAIRNLTESFGEDLVSKWITEALGVAPDGVRREDERVSEAISTLREEVNDASTVEE